MSEASDSRLPARLRIFALAGAILVGIGLIGKIAWRESRERQLGSPDQPLVMILSPAYGGPQTAQPITPDRIRLLTEFIARECSLAVTVRLAPTPLEAIVAFDEQAGHPADFGLLNLFQYGLARHEYQTEAGLQVLRGAGVSDYAGVIVVRADATARTVQDLRGHRLAFSGPFSTSGFIFPVRLLTEAGVAVAPEFAASHDQALAWLLAGRVEAAATYENAAAGDSRVRVIARTEAIPNEPVCFRRGLRADQRAALLAALTRFAATEAGRDFLADLAGITGFRAIDDTEYRDAFAAINAAGRTIYEMVPEGTRLEAERRRIDFLL